MEGENGLAASEELIDVLVFFQRNPEPDVHILSRNFCVRKAEFFNFPLKKLVELVMSELGMVSMKAEDCFVLATDESALPLCHNLFDAWTRFSVSQIRLTLKFDMLSRQEQQMLMFREGICVVPSFEDVWNDPAHRSDSGCFALFRSLQASDASYDLLDWTVSMLEKVLCQFVVKFFFFFFMFYSIELLSAAKAFSERLGCFDLVVRGSVATRTALKNFATIDLDLILPRFLWSFERIAQG